MTTNKTDSASVADEKAPPAIRTVRIQSVWSDMYIDYPSLSGSRKLRQSTLKRDSLSQIWQLEPISTTAETTVYKLRHRETGGYLIPTTYGTSNGVVNLDVGPFGHGFELLPRKPDNADGDSGQIICVANEKVTYGISVEHSSKDDGAKLILIKTLSDSDSGSANLRWILKSVKAEVYANLD